MTLKKQCHNFSCGIYLHHMWYIPDVRAGMGGLTVMVTLQLWGKVQACVWMCQNRCDNLHDNVHKCLLLSESVECDFVKSDMGK